MMEHEQTFAGWLKQQRKALDLTQADLARAVGCAVVTLQKIEEGQRRPSKQVAELLAQHLAIAPDQRETFLRLARADLPRARTAPTSPLHLPVPLTPLIGRATESAIVWNYLTSPDMRLVTLVGPPGVGKTRLSMQVASEMGEHFPDGIWFVALAAIQEPQLVVPTIAQTLGLREAGTQPLLERLKTALRTKRALLVLDNLEQVVDAAPQIAELLAACGQVKVLASSRVRLHVYGEHEYLVEPFAIPDKSASSVLEHLMEFEAVRLFVARVQAFKPEFALTAVNADAVAEICTRLDGLPLAIELVAARVRQFTPAALAAQMRHAGATLLPLLSGGPRDLPARQQTLHNAITWSYDLLDPAQQHLFRQLGIFVGGWTDEAVAAVCAHASADVLQSLGDHQLVRHVHAESRWTMLEIIRAYALAELRTRGEYESAAHAHAGYFLQLAETYENEPAWLAQMEQEHDNLRAALCWALRYDAADIGLRLCIALWWFWESLGHWSEGRQWIETMLAAADHAAPARRMQALRCVAEFAWKQGDYAQVERRVTECLRIAESIQDTGMMAHANMLLGKAALDQGHFPAARALLQASTALYQVLGEDVAGAFMFLAELALVTEDYEQARQLSEQFLVRCEAVGNDFFAARTLCLLGETMLALGEHGAARRRLRESVARSQAIGHRRALVFGLTAFAGAVACDPAASTDEVRAVARIWGAVEVVREDVGVFVPITDQERYEHARATAQARVSSEDWAVARNAGRAMSLEQAITLALDLPHAEEQYAPGS